MSQQPAPPPVELTADLELEPSAWSERDTYHLVTALVVPRPIAWVSTRSRGGVLNVAPHSYFNLVGHAPPHVMFSCTGVRDTLRNVRESGEFVVNIVSEDLVEEMNLTSADLPAREDEFRWAGLSALPSTRVAAPRVGEAKAHLECRVREELAIGGAHVVIGEVVHIHVDKNVWRGGRVDPQLLAPVARLAGTAYAAIDRVFKLPRPTWDDLRESGPRARSSRSLG